MNNEELKNIKCKKCKTIIVYTEADTFWDESGYGYSTKLIKCPYCGCYHAVRYEEDDWIKELDMYSKYYKRRK